MPRSPASTKRLIAAKRAIIRAAKDRPCADCGRRFPSVCLDFDHVRGDKCADVSHMANDNRSIDALQREIRKCVVRCANCHRIRTHT